VHLKKEEKVAAIDRKRVLREALAGGILVGVVSGLIVLALFKAVSKMETTTLQELLIFNIILVIGFFSYALSVYLRALSHQKTLLELDRFTQEAVRVADDTRIAWENHKAQLGMIQKERIALLKEATYIRPVPESVGMSIRDLLQIMINTANAIPSRVYTTYQDQTLIVYPGQSVEGAYRTWKADPHLAYDFQGIYREAKRLKAVRLIQEKKRRRLFRALKHAPAMARDEMVWHNIAKHLVKVPSDAATLRFAENWARLMQAQLAKGVSIKNSAEKMARVAYVEPSCSRNAAFVILLSCWKYHRSLRNWRYGSSRSSSKKKADHFNGRIVNTVKMMVIRIQN
jgi:hypothetical protein